MFSTFVGLGRFINCQRPDCTKTEYLKGSIFRLHSTHIAEKITSVTFRNYE